VIQAFDLAKSYGDRVLFENINFTLSKGERVGLLGRNGAGKSTLFQMIMGKVLPDAGKIVAPKNYKIGHLNQHLVFTYPTVLDEVCSVLSEEERHLTYQAEKILMGLGFSLEQMKRSPQSFSGGQQIRFQLAKLFLESPNLLLLDEPTNYLDFPSLIWLVDFLKRYDGEVLLITHDRSFMGQVVTHSMGISFGELKKVPGPPEQYFRWRDEEEVRRSSLQQNQLKKIKHLENFVERFGAKASKATQAQSKLKALEKLKDQLPSELDGSFENKELRSIFQYSPLSSKQLMHCEDISFGHQFPEKTLIKNLGFYINRGDRIGIFGANGTGKSTLLKLLAGEYSPNLGTLHRHPELKIGYFGQTNVDRLHAESSVIDEVMQSNTNLSVQQIRSICGAVCFEGDDALKKVKVLSGGEKARVLLGKVMSSSCQLLILDEPTNHLDMESVDSLIESLKSFQGAIVFVTHSEFILKELANQLIVFSESGAPEFHLGSFDDYTRRLKNAEKEAENIFKVKDQQTEYKEDKKIKNSKVDEYENLDFAKRQEIKRERRGLEKKMNDLEERIIYLESLKEKTMGKLELASIEQKSTEIIELSKNLKQTDSEIEEAFFKLEEAEEKLSLLPSLT